MKEINGPVRIIMIHSGKYEYAEVDINEGVHLVGSNNCGKTTLISTLQFLYIDKEKSFNFSHDKSKSKKYYFKDEYSYILFECITSSGYMVIGARGTSSLGSGDFERFIYNGSYKKEDFFNGDEIVKGDEVKVRLSVKKYKVLTPSLVRAALTGKDIGDGLILNILPIKSSGGYEKFRNTYKNLLQLSNIGQIEFKDALIQVCTPELIVKDGIDFQESYTPMYNKIRRVSNEIDSIKKLRPFIEESFKLFNQRKEARIKIVAGYKIIIEKLKFIKKQNIKIIEEKKLEVFEKKIKAEKLEFKYKEIDEEIAEKNQKIGYLGREIELLEEDIKNFQGYIPTLELPQIKQLELKLTGKLKGLALVDMEKVEIVEARLNKNKKDLFRLNKRISNFEDTLAKKLSSVFDQNQLAQFFALFNHKLLDQTIVNGTVEIFNFNNLVKNIHDVIGKIKDETYIDDAISISLAQELKPDLSDFFDIEKIKKRIVHKKSEIKRDEDTLSFSKEQKELKEDCDKLKEDIAFRKRKHSEYLAFKEKKPLEQLQNDKKIIKNERDAKKKELKDLSKEKNDLEKEINTLQKEITEIGKNEVELDREVSLLQKPNSYWTAPDDYNILDEDINSLIEAHKIYGGQEKTTSNDLEKNLSYIETTLGPKVSYESDEKFLEYLKLEVDDLDQKEKVVEEMWEKALTSLQTSLRDILDDLETINKQAGLINRTLSKIQISDLVGVKIIVEQNKHITGYIKKLISNAFTTDFLELANQNRSTEPLKELQNRFLGKGKIELTDLFTLKFEVEKIDGDVDSYTSLNSVESNGTTTTIKVLVNLILMKGLFEERNKENVRIPFYLDEVASLDSHNARAVTQQAVKLGFTPIVASPTPSHIVNKLYLLRGGTKQGLYVNNRNMTYIQSN